MKLNENNKECIIELNQDDVNELYNYFSDTIFVYRTGYTVARDTLPFFRALELANTIEGKE